MVRRRVRQVIWRPDATRRRIDVFLRSPAPPPKPPHPSLLPSLSPPPHRLPLPQPPHSRGPQEPLLAFVFLPLRDAFPLSHLYLISDDSERNLPSWSTLLGLLRPVHIHHRRGGWAGCTPLKSMASCDAQDRQVLTFPFVLTICTSEAATSPS